VLVVVLVTDLFLGVEELGVWLMFFKALQIVTMSLIVHSLNNCKAISRIVNLIRLLQLAHKGHRVHILVLNKEGDQLFDFKGIYALVDRQDLQASHEITSALEDSDQGVQTESDPREFLRFQVELKDVDDQ
jgi:hypothetical protein